MTSTSLRRGATGPSPTARGPPPPRPRAPGPLPVGPDAVHHLAQNRALADGKKLCPQEEAKRKRHPLDMWDDLVKHAAEARFPKGDDVLAFKYQGLFYVAPAQDSYMCRLRMPGGILTAHQFRGIAGIVGVAVALFLGYRSSQSGAPETDFIIGERDEQAGAHIATLLVRNPSRQPIVLR